MLYRLLTFGTFLVCVVWLALAPGFGPAVACLASVTAAFRYEFHGVIGMHLLSLTPRDAPVRSLTNTRYSFSKPEFVNPMVLADLHGWMSDTGDQVVSINVPGANTSNRYFATVTVTDKGTYPVVSARQNEQSFSYQYLGCSFSGVHLLRTWSSGGGSGVFCDIMLVTLGTESAAEIDPSAVKKVERFVVRKVAMIPLGDRYEGQLSYRLGLLTIGACRGMATLRNRKQRLAIL